MSESLASPFGCWSLAERSSNAAELIAPQDTTTIIPRSSLRRLPLCLITKFVDFRPEAAGFQTFDVRIGHQGYIRMV